MKRYSIILAVLSLSFGVGLTSCKSQDPLLVKTEAGYVRGINEHSVQAFYGIPYARAERFMPPTKTEKWDTVMVCDHFGPICYQASQPDEERFIPMSEDCQVLNVWTKNTQAKKKMPVILWIHGGGYGAGTTSWNPGMGLAHKDVVFVSLHHRLNILGFLDLSACGEKYKYSGNQSLLDVVACLEWIRDNISAFGGDPSNVTIVGQSGGGGKVANILCMPSAKDLFNKAIIMSGVFYDNNSRELSQQLGLEVLNQLGISPEEVDNIKDVPYAELAAAGNRASRVLAEKSDNPGAIMFASFSPTPDGEVVVQAPYEPSFPDFSSKKPIIMGTTISEGERYPGDISLDEAKAMLRERLGDETDRFVECFQAAWPDCTPGDMLAVDDGLRSSTLEVSDRISKIHGAPVYCYMFNCKSPKTHVAAHGDDVDFAFNRLWDETDGSHTEAEHHVSDVMSQAWANFCYTGDPNVAGEPTWHPYNQENGEMFIFQENCTIKYNFDREYQEILARHPAAPRY